MRALTLCLLPLLLAACSEQPEPKAEPETDQPLAQAETPLTDPETQPAVAESTAASDACQPSPIPREQQRMGCGCNYWQPSGRDFKPLLQADIQFSEARMMLGGELVQLEVVQAEPIPINSQDGQQFIQDFRYGDIDIQLDAVINTSCGPQEQNCEVIGLVGNLKLVGPNCQVLVENLAGDCGC